MWLMCSHAGKKIQTTEHLDIFYGRHFKWHPPPPFLIYMRNYYEEFTWVITMLPGQQSTDFNTQEINWVRFKHLFFFFDKFLVSFDILEVYWLATECCVRLMLIVPANPVSAAFRQSSVSFIQHLLWEFHGCLEVSHPGRECLWWWVASWQGREAKLFFNHLLISFIMFPFYSSSKYSIVLRGITCGQHFFLELLLSNSPGLPASLLCQTIRRYEVCSM